MKWTTAERFPSVLHVNATAHTVIFIPSEKQCSLRRRMDGCLNEERFEREDRSVAGLEMSFLLSWRTAVSRQRTAELMQHIIIPAREAHYKNSTLQCDALHTLGQHFSASTASGRRFYIGHHVVAQSCLSYKVEQKCSDFQLHRCNIHFCCWCPTKLFWHIHWMRNKIFWRMWL